MNEDRIRADAEAAFAALLAAHPDHAETIRSMMWMGEDEGVHAFKHRISRKHIRFDPATDTVTGELETGEESDDVGMVMREAGII